eukprot:INCI19722.1.p1 GENE.INCI19722.1~~INCI19722.1.p1  ORF type:complete len:165 (-),score=35.59 INCI19722.1:5-499(-)
MFAAEHYERKFMQTHHFTPRYLRIFVIAGTAFALAMVAVAYINIAYGGGSPNPFAKVANFLQPVLLLLNMVVFIAIAAVPALRRYWPAVTIFVVVEQVLDFFLDFAQTYPGADFFVQRFFSNITLEKYGEPIILPSCSETFYDGVFESNSCSGIQFENVSHLFF